VHLAQVLGVDLRVDLRGGQVGVAQHGLHRSQVGAALHQVGGEAVAQLVGRDRAAESELAAFADQSFEVGRVYVLDQPLLLILRNEGRDVQRVFGGAELGCRVLLKVLEISSAPEFLDHVNRLAEAFADGVETLRQKHSDFLVRLRQLGLFMGLELADEQCGPLVTAAGYHHGLWMIYANNDPRIMQFLPPLNIGLELVDEIMTRLDASLLAAKQRELAANDWLERDTLVACPDPDERLIMRIERIARRSLDSDELT